MQEINAEYDRLFKILKDQHENNCPVNIAIPKCFSLYHADMQELETKAWTAQTMLYGHFAEQFGKASACADCGQCEKMCPRHLPVREWLKQVAERFEGRFLR